MSALTALRRSAGVLRRAQHACYACFAPNAKPNSWLLALGLATLLAGAALRFVGLDAWSFWGDEVASLNISAAAANEIWRRAEELHPPLYYLFLHGWQGMGTGEAWQRLPSALAGVLTLPLMWRTGAALGDEAMGVLAMGLLALSPLHIWYSREARMYIFACLFAVAALYCAVRLVRGGTLRHAVGLAAVTLLAVYTAYAALLFWAALLVLFPIVARRTGIGRNQARAFWLAQAAVAAAFACYLPVLGAQIATGNLGFLGRRLAGLIPEVSGIAVGAAALLAILCARQFRRGRRRLQAAAWMPWTVIAVFAACTVLAAVPRGFSIKRQLLIFWPVVTLAAAWALCRIGRGALPVGGDGAGLRLAQHAWGAPGEDGAPFDKLRGLRRGGPAAATLALSLAATVVLLAAGPAEDWRGAAAYIATVALPGDVIYAQSDLAGAAIAHYYRGPAAIYAPDALRHWSTPAPTPAHGATVWLVANDHPGLQDEMAAVSARLSPWGPPEERAAFARHLRILAYHTAASISDTLHSTFDLAHST